MGKGGSYPGAMQFFGPAEFSKSYKIPQLLLFLFFLLRPFPAPRVRFIAHLAVVAGVVSTVFALPTDRHYKEHHDDHDHDHENPMSKHYKVSYDPRPFYIINNMTESPLKKKLESCENGPFSVTGFSIGHRGGATLQFPEETVVIPNAICTPPPTSFCTPNWLPNALSPSPPRMQHSLPMLFAAPAISRWMNTRVCVGSKTASMPARQTWKTTKTEHQTGEQIYTPPAAQS